MCTVAAASGAASVRVWHITSRGWDPWTERPLPEVVCVAYPPLVPHGNKSRRRMCNARRRARGEASTLFERPAEVREHPEGEQVDAQEGLDARHDPHPAGRPQGVLAGL